MMKKSFCNALHAAIALSIGAVFLTGCGRGAKPEEKRPDPTADGSLPKIVVIAGKPGSNWKPARQGAQDAAKALDATIEWHGLNPKSKDWIKDQEKIIDSAIAGTASAIMIAPVDPTELAPAVNKGGKKYVPTVVFDSPAYTKFSLSYVANDDAKTKALIGKNSGVVVGSGTPEEIQKLQSGQITTLVVPDRYTMAYESVRAIMSYRKQEPPALQIKIPPVLVTRENLNQPEIRRVLGR